MQTGIERIAAERQRQIDVEGWTPEHDDEHDDGSLAMAACCYAAPAKIYTKEDFANSLSFDDPWRWEDHWDKRFGYGSTRAGGEDEGANFRPDPETYNNGERLDLLTKSGALIAAEIDRLVRLQARQQGNKQDA